MKKRLFLSFVLALALVALPVVSAMAGNIFHFRGKNADAFFSSFDPSGCIGTFVGVFANDGRFQAPPGSGSSSSGASLFIDQVDFCAGTQLLAASGFASLDGPAFQIDRGLNSATLNATIGVFDSVSLSSFDVDVALTWAGTGDLSSGSSNSHFKSPNCIINSRSRGTFRPAEASGSVSAGATNFTPNPSVGASLSSVKNGEVQIGCGF